MAGSFFVEDGYYSAEVDPSPKQPLDADLTAIAALSGTGFLKSTAGVWTLEASIPSSTAWGTITGTLSSQTDLQSALDAKAASVHTHDDRYYTETETNTLLAGKADFSHNHDSRYYTEFEIDGIVAGYQPLDADLTAIGGLAGTSGYLKKTAANTWTLDTSTFAASSHTHAQSDITNLVTDLAGKAATSHTHTASNISDSTTAGRALLTAVDAAAQRTSLSLVVGTNVQAWDADLDAIAALAGTSGFLKKTGTNTWTLDTNTYLIGNQTVTLSGDISGAGATAITTAIGANKVTNAMLSQVATARFKGRVTAATGNVEDLTGTQATTLLDVFTSTLKGLAPASGGGTSNFLRADGTWAAPASGGGTWGSITGTLSSQTDLQSALDAKAASSHTHTASAISDSTIAGRSMLTAADAAAQTALLDTFTSALKGLAPASGGGTTNFLRADGSWAAPPSGGSPAWGSITGTLSSQTDLQSALDAKSPLASPTFTGTPAAPTAVANTNTTQIATTAFVLGQANSTAGTIAMDGTQAAGTSNLYARADHVHPTDTSRAPLASPTFTGTPAAPTAAANTNTTQLATTAFVLGQGNTTAATIAMNGTQAAGTSNLYARADHVHPVDTSRAPLASPTFTGTPAAPTATAYTSTTQLATTANVVATVKLVPENAQVGTTYTLVLADAGKMVTLTNAAAITLTIPTNATVAFPVGTRIDLAQMGAGQVTIGGAGVTIRSSGSRLKLTGQYSGATLWKQATDTWLLVGDITT